MLLKHTGHETDFTYKKRSSEACKSHVYMYSFKKSKIHCVGKMLSKLFKWTTCQANNLKTLNIVFEHPKNT